MLGLFILQQAKTRSEPLVPLELFRDRNFSGANVAIAAVGFTVTSMSLPMMFFLQTARGLTPTEAALLLIPMAVLSGVLAPVAGEAARPRGSAHHPDPGLLCVAGALIWYSALINMDTAIWMFLLPSALMGVGNAGMWGPLATTAAQAPRRARLVQVPGIYNTTGPSVRSSATASIAAFMRSPGSRRTFRVFADSSAGGLHRRDAAAPGGRRLRRRNVAGDLLRRA